MPRSWLDVALHCPFAVEVSIDEPLNEDDEPHGEYELEASTFIGELIIESWSLYPIGRPPN